jgi:medium-chain acyl-[acyl-carrier-protein] hydrolase
LDLPFAFYGHSLGGLIVFELARELRRNHDIQPVQLVVSGTRAPQCAHRERAIHSLPGAEFIAELRRLNGTPDGILENPELMEIMLPLLRADFALYEKYSYAVELPLGCPIAAFGGWDDPRVEYSDLEAWGDQTTASFSLNMFRGGHFFLNTAPSLLLHALSKELQLQMDKLR